MGLLLSGFRLEPGLRPDLTWSRRIAVSIEDVNTHPRDLAVLPRQSQEIAKELAALRLPRMRAGKLSDLAVHAFHSTWAAQN